jgi:2,4-dienoyl-CoA reductase-like NADH-dependent reductase (Old Yellow Enzyme family)
MSTMPKRGGGSLATPYLERTIPSFRAVANAVHRQGSKIFAEIHYSRVGNLWSYEPGSSNAPLFGPSPVQTADELVPEGGGLTQADNREVATGRRADLGLGRELAGRAEQVPAASLGLAGPRVVIS